MFEKGPICLKNDPYVPHTLRFQKHFIPHLLEKPHMLQTGSPYAANMFPIGGP